MKRIFPLLLLIIPAAVAMASISITLEGGRAGLTSNSVIDISHDGSSIWLGTGGGAALSTDDGLTWTTFGADAGLPRDEISALAANNRGVWLANSHTEEISGDNIPFGDSISFSSDGGTTWQTFGPRQVSWAGMLSYDISVYDSLVYSACFYGGLIRSTDFGLTWENLFPSQLSPINTDSVDFVNNNFSSLNNRMFSVQVDTTAFPDTFSVWAGSAAGINHFIYNSWNRYGWHRDSVWSSGVASVLGASPDNQNDDWLISPGVDFTGATACSLSFRQYYYDLSPLIDSAIVLLSDNGGVSWPETVAVFADSSLGNTDVPDSQYFDISSFAAGKSSVSVAFKYTTRVTFPSGHWTLDDVSLGADGSALHAETFDSAWGSLGDNPPAGWSIIDNERSPGVYNLYPDSIFHVTREDTTIADSLKLPGDFVVALGVQRFGGSKYIWAACRPAFSGYLRVGYSADEGETWNEAPIGGLSNTVEAWNFAFAEDTVYVATSIGLFRSSGDFSSWTRLSDFIDLQKQTFYQYDAPFYAVDLVDSTIWAGGSDGVVKSLDTGGWSVFRSSLDADNHFAYPSPFSPYHSARKGTTIHFKPATDTKATIKIYDINLELVKTVASGVQRIGGVESDDIIWNGSNDKGDLVANGVYFYRIELDSGEDLWGKVVVIK